MERRLLEGAVVATATGVDGVRRSHAEAAIRGSSYLRWVQGESAADEEHA